MPAGQHAEDAPYRSLQKWENLAEQRIREAQEEGLFDDLPGRGQPLTLDDNPLAGDMQVGFRLLKNAGFAPEWIELDKEIRAELEALRELRERAARRVAELRTAGGDAPAPPGNGKRSLLHWLGLSRQTSRQPGGSSRRDRVRIAMAERERARAEYLDRAARLSERIRLFNGVRPRDVWSLERLVPTTEDHAWEFDTVCPPVVDEGGPESRYDR